MRWIKAAFLPLFLCVCPVAGKSQDVINADNKEVAVIPASYALSKVFDDKGPVKTGKSKKRGAGFKAELDKLAAQTVTAGGNVLQLTRIEDHKQSGRYRFWGEVYHTPDIASFKNMIAESKARRFAGGSAGYLIIYCPAYGDGGFNDSVKFRITINDTLALPMQAGTRYTIKLAKAADVKLEVKHKNFIQDMNVHVQPGSACYVRSYVCFPGTHKYIGNGEFKVKVRGYTPYLEKIDNNLQGELESNMVSQLIFSRNL